MGLRPGSSRKASAFMRGATPAVCAIASSDELSAVERQGQAQHALPVDHANFDGTAALQPGQQGHETGPKEYTAGIEACAVYRTCREVNTIGSSFGRSLVQLSAGKAATSPLRGRSRH